MTRRRASLRDDPTLFAGRGDRLRIERLRCVLLDPPLLDVDTVADAVAAYRVAHPGASREEVYREAVQGRGLAAERKRDALRVIDAALEARGTVAARGNDWERSWNGREGRPVIAPRDSHEPISGEMWAAIVKRWPDEPKLFTALMLALDVDTAAALIEGKTVDVSRVDQRALSDARHRRRIGFIAPVELLTSAEEAAA